MEKWLLFYRIDMYCTWIAISNGVKFVLYIDAVAAFAGFHAFKRALVGAVGAFNATCRNFIVVSLTTPFPHGTFKRDLRKFIYSSHKYVVLTNQAGC